jgi:eukaryotic-like serine/threonine-protein kinase
MIAPAGRHLGKYEIRQKLGRGGMADVYLADDTAAGHQVALKLIEHADDADTRDSIEAERRGAELQASLAAIDPRVVGVYDFGDLDGFFFVAMEYVEGQDLAALMRGRRLEVEFAADTAIAVAETLAKSHSLQVNLAGKDYQGIVHGDIKPKNIRIDKHGEVRVLDFGIAKALSLSRRLTRNEFGSVPYASPERLDEGQVNVLSDLWSLAVMLYEMVTGMQPYHADSTEVLERMIRSRIPPPPAPDPCPEPLRRILVKATAPDPGLRYQTAGELADDLMAFRHGQPVRAVSEDLDATRRTVRPAAADDETRRTTAPTPSPPPRAERPKGRIGIFGSGMRLAAILALLFFLWGALDIYSGYQRYQHGQQLERQIETEQLTDPDQIWQKWTELSGGDSSSLLLHGPRKAVKQKLVDGADQVIAAYRSTDAPAAYEKDWNHARIMLAHALALDPEDAVRGRLRLTEGHIARINGVAHRDPKLLQTAVDDFTQAARLLPRSPDPELGLARLYLQGFKDIDKATAALEEAQKRGYQLGSREELQLADGYRDRADRLFWDSRGMRGLPQEKDQIERAANAYQRALDLYQKNMADGGFVAIAGMLRVRASLASVNSRLAQIANASPGESHL